MSDHTPDPDAPLPHRGAIPSSVVDALPMPVLVSRRADDVALTVNAEFTHTYGYEAADVTGKSSRELHFVEDDRRLTLDAHARGRIESVEVRLKSATGECKWAQADLALFSLDGRDDVLLTTFYDIGARKEAETLLHQSEKMAMLGTLAAGIGHELNNPASAAQRAAQQLERSFAALDKAQLLMGASGSLGKHADLLVDLATKAKEAAACPCLLDPLVRSDLEAELEDWLAEHDAEAPWETASALVEGGVTLTEVAALAAQIGSDDVGLVATWHGYTHRVYRLLGEIRQGTGRLAEIVGAMKAYSYLGHAPVQNVDVNDGIRNTLVMLRSKLKPGIRVEQELSKDLPLIEAFGSELNQVWTNLIDNAADAMNGQGQIRLRTSAVDDRVVVEIEDNGPGIPPEVQSRVFDAFFTTKAPGKGTGLGLNISHTIVVQKHGGSMRVDSAPGGTRFTVELPVRRPPQAGTPESAAETTGDDA